MTLNMPYDEVVKKIIAETNLSKEEVVQRIEEKVKELGGLITLEGAAHIIAREMEINLYDSQQVEKPKPTTIADLIPGMNNVTLTALIRTIYDPKHFAKKDGSQGAVQNIHLIDKSGDCRLVIWDDQIRQFNEIGLERGDIIRILGAYVKESKYDGIKELSLSSRSRIDSDLTDIKKDDFPDKLLETKKIESMSVGLTDVELVGQIAAIRPINTFTKKDGTSGQVASLEIADETGKIRITLWDSKAELISNFKIGDIVRVNGGYTRQGIKNTIEVHLGKNGSIEKDPKASIKVPKEILETDSTLTPVSKSKSVPMKEVRLADLNENMRNISIIARVSAISTIREFSRSDGTTSVVGSLLVIDSSSNGRVTFWNNMVDYIKQVEIGDVIRIEGAYVRLGLKGEPEVHVSAGSTVKINPEYLEDAVPELTFKYSKLSSLEPKQQDVNIKAVVTRVPEVRHFTKRDGSEGSVLNIGITDETGSIRLVAWDKHAIELETLDEMVAIEVLHGYTKEGQQGIEIHLGSISTVKQIDSSEVPEFTSLVSEHHSTPKRSSPKRADMIDLEDGNVYEVRGTILKVYEGKLYYLSCPECRKKVSETEDTWLCSEHGEVAEPEPALFFSIALDDGTGCIRVTFFREKAEQLIGIATKNLVEEIEQAGLQQVLAKIEQRIKSRELVVTGKAKKNSYDEGMDITAYSFSDFDPKNEIELLKSSLNV